MAEHNDPHPTPRRRAPRVAAERIQLQVEGRPARLVDLSEQGMRFVTDEAVEPGAILAATLTAGQQRLDVEGTVRWCEPEAEGGDGYGVGVAFRGSNPQVLRQGVLNLFLAVG